MFVSLVLYKGVYLACPVGGNENELVILLLVLSLYVRWKLIEIVSLCNVVGSQK